VQLLLSFGAKYWKEILIALLLLVASTFWHQDRSSLIKALDSASARYEQELTIIKESHARELEKKKILIEEHEDSLEELQRDYDKAQKEMEALKVERIKELVDLRTTDPETLARQIENAFGFEYVE
jgi:uncharacterized membrane protein